jgi:hypothetical protein
MLQKNCTTLEKGKEKRTKINIYMTRGMRGS